MFIIYFVGAIILLLSGYMVKLNVRELNETKDPVYAVVAGLYMTSIVLVAYMLYSFTSK